MAQLGDKKGACALERPRDTLHPRTERNDVAAPQPDCGASRMAGMRIHSEDDLNPYRAVRQTASG